MHFASHSKYSSTSAEYLIATKPIENAGPRNEWDKVSYLIVQILWIGKLKLLKQINFKSAMLNLDDWLIYRSIDWLIDYLINWLICLIRLKISCDTIIWESLFHRTTEDSRSLRQRYIWRLGHTVRYTCREKGGNSLPMLTAPSTHSNGPLCTT